MRNPTLAGILSLLIPGVGQIYNGRLGVGLGWFAVSIIMWFMAIHTFGLTAIAYHAISGWCAYSYAKDNRVRGELSSGY
jgi:TM2 domain-containing membrane protein YozV